MSAPAQTTSPFSKALATLSRISSPQNCSRTPPSRSTRKPRRHQAPSSHHELCDSSVFAIFAGVSLRPLRFRTFSVSSADFLCVLCGYRLLIWFQRSSEFDPMRNLGPSLTCIQIITCLTKLYPAPVRFLRPKLPQMPSHTRKVFCLRGRTRHGAFDQTSMVCPALFYSRAFVRLLETQTCSST